MCSRTQRRWASKRIPERDSVSCRRLLIEVCVPRGNLEERKVAFREGGECGRRVEARLEEEVREHLARCPSPEASACSMWASMPWSWRLSSGGRVDPMPKVLRVLAGHGFLLLAAVRGPDQLLLDIDTPVMAASCQLDGLRPGGRRQEIPGQTRSHIASRRRRYPTPLACVSQRIRDVPQRRQETGLLGSGCGLPQGSPVARRRPVENFRNNTSATRTQRAVWRLKPSRCQGFGRAAQTGCACHRSRPLVQPATSEIGL